jgi:hypothetical protein
VGKIAITYFPFDAGAGASVYEAQWRKMAEHWLSTGVLRGELNQFAVSADGSGMTVSVATGKAWLKGQYVESDAVAALSIDAADGANPRIDRVILRNTYGAPGVAGSIALAVLKGTAAGSPTAPALTQNTTTMWEISLAQVRVDAGAVVVAADKVTDERVMVDVNGETVQPLYKSATTVTVASTTTETDLARVTIPAGRLGATGGLRIKAWGTHKNQYQDADSVALRLKLGSTTLVASLLSVDEVSATNFAWRLDAVILNATAASQKAHYDIFHNAGGVIDEVWNIDSAAATEDTAANVDLALTADPSANNANLTCSLLGVIIEVINP